MRMFLGVGTSVPVVSGKRRRYAGQALKPMVMERFNSIEVLVRESGA